jgi:hypothetical protein
LGELVRLQGLGILRTWKTSARSLFTIVEARNEKATATHDQRRGADGRVAAY